MTLHQRLRQAGADAGRLIQENARLRIQLSRSQKEVEELEAANFNLCVERDAADALVGEAMDVVLERP